MAAAPRTLAEILKDYGRAAAAADPDGAHAAGIRAELRAGCPIEELDDAARAYVRLLEFQCFLEREDDRLERCPSRLRAVAAAEAADSPVRPDALADLRAH